MVKQAIEDAEENAKLNGMLLSPPLGPRFSLLPLPTQESEPYPSHYCPHFTPLPLPLSPSPSDISNVQYVCGKAEDVMSKIELPWVRLGGIVGVVDPPRGGLRKFKINCGRGCYVGRV